MKPTTPVSKRSRRPARLALPALAALALASHPLPAQQAGASPVKIFILAGQSNMVGMGEMSPVTTPGTLEFIIANNPDYAFMGDGSGGFKTLDDVWIRDKDGNGGGLTAGYGGSTTRIGPELGFGHAVGELYEEQVLIIKTAWGGRSLGKNFLPPSSGPYPEPEADGDPGYQYKQIVDIVADVTTNLSTYFPGYSGEGYEIAGFCWHQGWNDRIDTAFSDAYEVNMANFINDIRGDLGAPAMPFVIATSAMDPNFLYTQVEKAQLAMADADRHPDFVGNVAVIDARQPYKDLEFWQLSSDSPRNEGYHWNRNAKTYTNLGLAMADAMSVMVPARCPYRLQAAGDAEGVTLHWSEGTDSPTNLQVLRNGVEIAASAPLDSPSYLDSSAEPGPLEYQLNFTMPGDPCPPLTLTFDAGITDLEAYRVQDKVKLTWTNHLGYTAIEVRRNGEVIEPSLAGTNTVYLDASAPTSGTATYRVVPTNGTATPAEASIDLDGLSPGNALIYEPFADADPSLSENPTGAGLDKRWIGGLNVAGGSLSYGTLPTSGNRAFNDGGGNTSAGALIRPELAEAGLLDDGEELWFSFLTNNTTGVNTAAFFLLGTDRCGFFSGMDDGGEGIGVNFSRGSTPEAATWAPGRSAGSSSGSIASDTTALVVGRITWGADADAEDTVEIFLPGTDLVLPGSPVSTRRAALDQSQFDVVCFGGKNADSPGVDEIRFAATYDDVVALDQIVDDTAAPDPDPMTWASPPAPEGDSSIRMTATTAIDGSGIEYYFTETSGSPGGDDSGWQESPSYTDTGLNPGTLYAYTVKARDKSANQNETATSTPPAQATTAPLDTVPPATPGFESGPDALSTSEISMTASAVSDPSGVEYYFAETSGNPGGSDSGWQDGTSYTDTGLDPSTPYSYTVKARDKSSAQNESPASAAFGATTPDLPVGPGGAFIYEPFDDPNSSLAGNTPGLGLTGTWSGGAAVTNGSIGFGLLATQGQQVHMGGNNGSITPDETLDPFLSNGSTLWFSLTLRTGTDVGTNPDIGFALGTNPINGSNNLPLGDAGDGGLGLGFTIKQGQLRASWWDAGDGNGTAVSRSSTNSGNNVTTESTYLIVGELAFGATDTLRLYLPDSDLQPGPAVSTAEVSLDQTRFDTISFAAKGAGAPHAIDEIRFGTSYEAAVGLGGEGDDYATWSDGFPTADLSDPDADLDGDGRTNDEERIWGTDPTDPGSRSALTVALNPSSGTFSYNRRDDGQTGLTYHIWTSPDLVAWTKDTTAQQLAGTPDADDVETVAVTITETRLTGPKLFVRVSAE